MKTKTIVPVTLEIMGIAVVGAGIGIELAMHAAFGMVLITIGSCIVATGGIIWYRLLSP